MSWTKLKLKKCISPSGELFVIESSFERAFFVFCEDDGGGHAHKECTQILVPVRGEIKIMLQDGEKRETIVLSDPEDALVVYPMTWLEYFPVKDSVLLVFCSHKYNENEYIRDRSALS